MGLVAASTPDGYMLGVANLSFAANPFLLSKMPYDTEKDLVPVSLVVQVPMVLAVHPSVPVRSVNLFLVTPWHLTPLEVISLYPQHRRTLLSLFETRARADPERPCVLFQETT